MNFDNAKFIIIPAPIEKTVSYGAGTANGPQAILDAWPNLEFYDEDTDSEPQNYGIHTLTPENYENLTIEESINKLEQICLPIFKDKKIPFVLGGEHSLSIAPIRALKKINNDFTVIHLDAHADLREEYEGAKSSHACIMKRVYDENIPFISLGIRSLSKEESILIKQNNLNIFYAKDIVRDIKTIDIALKKIKTKNIYITFDIDVFDPSIIPATGTPEPGGLNWYDIMYVFEKLRDSQKNILGFDLVELAPRKEMPASDFICAKLIFKAMALIQLKIKN